MANTKALAFTVLMGLVCPAMADGVYVAYAYVPYLNLSPDPKGEVGTQLPSDLNRGQGNSVSFYMLEEGRPGVSTGIGLLSMATRHNENVSGQGAQLRANYIDFMTRLAGVDKKGFDFGLDASVGAGYLSVDTGRDLNNDSGMSAIVRLKARMQASSGIGVDVGYGFFGWGRWGDTQGNGDMLSTGLDFQF